MRLVDKGRVAGQREQPHRRVDRLELRDQRRRDTALKRVLRHRPHRVVDPIAPVNVLVVQCDGVRLVVCAVDQRVPGAVVLQVTAIDAVVHPLAFIAPV